jgi:all-trans-retinol dehydrogenase (NAD+)
MEAYIRILKGTVLLLWAILYSIVEPFIPKRLLHKNVKNQIVLITGAGSGFGRLLAKKFAIDHGSVVVLWDINKSGLDQTAKEVKAGGGRSHSFIVDVSSKEAIYAGAEKVKEQVGKVDILINNAGIAEAGNLVELEDAKIEKSFQINILAHYFTTKAFLPGMIKDGSGHIVTISSAAGLFGVPRLSAYCGTKFAAVGFHESIANEVKVAYPEAKIESTVICPYFVRTPILAGKEDQIESSTFLPIREPEPVVDEMVDAILTNQNMLIPSYGVRVLLFFKSNLPSRVMKVLRNMALPNPVKPKTH